MKLQIVFPFVFAWEEEKVKACLKSWKRPFVWKWKIGILVVLLNSGLWGSCIVKSLENAVKAAYMIYQMEEMNCKLITFGVYGKSFAAVLWMQWAEHYCHFQGKRRCCDKHSGKVGLRERHTQHDSRRNWRDLDQRRCWAVQEQWWCPQWSWKR